MELYRHSGRSGFFGVPLAVAGGATAAAVLGVVYAFFINWVPFIYLNFIATFCLGLGVGAAVGWASQIGKIRNHFINGVLGVLFGVVAVYIAWVFDPLARIGVEQGFVAWDFELLLEYMTFGYENGFWGLGRGGKGGNVTGPLLALVWLIEAGVVVVTAAVTATKFASDQPFCEADNCWTKTEQGVARLYALGDPGQAAVERLLEGDLTALAELIRADRGSASFLQCNLATCSDCTESNYLTVKLVQKTVNKDGNLETVETVLLNNLRVAHADLPKIRDAGRELTAQEIAAATAASEPPGELPQIKS